MPDQCWRSRNLYPFAWKDRFPGSSRRRRSPDRFSGLQQLENPAWLWFASRKNRGQGPFAQGSHPENDHRAGNHDHRWDKNKHPAPSKNSLPLWFHQGKLRHSIYGEIPEGCVIHHINGDKLDNCVGNLQAVSRAEHMNMHMHRWVLWHLDQYQNTMR